MCIPYEDSEGTLQATPAGWLVNGEITDYTARASGRAQSHSAGALRTWQNHLNAAEICSATVADFYQSHDPMQPLELANARQLAQRLMPGAPATEVAFLQGAFTADASLRCFAFAPGAMRMPISWLLACHIAHLSRTVASYGALLDPAILPVLGPCRRQQQSCECAS